jgi:hypothetical protein
VFKELKTYFFVLNALAYGYTKPTEIANFAGMNTISIYPYGKRKQIFFVVTWGNAELPRSREAITCT